MPTPSGAQDIPGICVFVCLQPTHPEPAHAVPPPGRSGLSCNSPIIVLDVCCWEPPGERTARLRGSTPQGVGPRSLAAPSPGGPSSNFCPEGRPRQVAPAVLIQWNHPDMVILKCVLCCRMPTELPHNWPMGRSHGMHSRTFCCRPAQGTPWQVAAARGILATTLPPPCHHLATTSPPPCHY